MQRAPLPTMLLDRTLPSSCSCSYALQPARPYRRPCIQRQAARVSAGVPPAAPSKSAAPKPSARSQPTGRQGTPRGLVSCTATEEEDAGPNAAISGYTPANYISFSEDPVNVGRHRVSIEVDAPPSVCFGIWDDWNRLVEFLDLVAQIGLDPNNQDMALFQCFYRHGLLPVMEIVFVLHKTEVVQDRSITFESVWGMPLSGAVTFTPLKDGKSTGLTLELAQAIPDMLLGVGVGPLGLQNSVEPILGENLEAFKQLAELAATSPERMPPRQEGGEQAYPLAIDERNMEYIRLVNSYAPDEDVVPGPAEPAQGAAAQQSGGEESAGEYDEGEELGEDEEEVEERPATSGRGAAAATATARGAAAAGLGAATVAGSAAARRGTAEVASSSTAGRAAAAPAPAATAGRRAAATAPSAPAAPAGRRVAAAAPGGGATAGSAGTDAGAAPVAGRKLRSRRTAS